MIPHWRIRPLLSTAYVQFVASFSYDSVEVSLLNKLAIYCDAEMFGSIKRLDDVGTEGGCKR